MTRKSKFVMIRIFLLFFFIYNLVLPVTYAYSVASFFSSTSSYRFHPIFTLTTGIASVKVGDNQNFPMIDASDYSFSASKRHDSEFVWGGFIGTEIALKQRWSLQLGIAYYQPSSFKQTGMLTQGHDLPSSNQFPYSYRTQSRQLLAESKLLFNLDPIYHPYASLGLGAAFNKDYSYQVNYPELLTFTPLFGDHTHTAFSYSVGFGVDVDVVKSLRIGAGYRFTDFGKNELASGVIDVTTIPNTLQQSHLYTQEFLLQLTYVMA